MLFIFIFLFLLFSLNLVVNPLYAEIWMWLPDIHFQKGPSPNLELPAYVSAEKRELQYCGAHRTWVKQASILESPGVVL